MRDGRHAGPPPLSARSWSAALRLRSCSAGVAAATVAAVILTLIAPPRPLLIWNVSPSAPIGLYVVASEQPPARGDMVAARLAPPWRSLASARRYLPANVPLIKRVAAAAGDRICATGADISVNDIAVARRLDRDAAGRPMPHWSGCIVLRPGQNLLLMPGSASFDGRYFGPTAQGDIVGKVDLLWAR